MPGHAEAEPAALAWHLRRPHALRLDLAAQLVEQVEADVLVLVEGVGVRLKGDDARLCEIADAQTQFVHLRREREVHCLPPRECRAAAKIAQHALARSRRPRQGRGANVQSQGA